MENKDTAATSAFHPCWATNYAGERILVLSDGNREILLDSAYSSADLAECWSLQQDISNVGTKIVLFGLADGHYAKKLHEKNPDALILVYEPSEELSEFVRNEPIVQELINEQVIIVRGEKDFLPFCRSMTNVLEYEDREYFRVFVSPNYNVLYEDMIRELYGQMNSLLARLQVFRNTHADMGPLFNRSMAANMIDCVEQHFLYDLIEEFRREDLKDVPAIIVAAGPSLDKNIHELAKAKNHAFIIAVDSSLNALARANIIPDIFVTVDPEKPERVMDDPRMQEVPCSFLLQANPEIRRRHRATRIYYMASQPLLGKYLTKYNIEKTILASGGSVANDAYSLAVRLGFKTVIMIGQDLAYPNGQIHSSNSYDKEVDNTIDLEEGKYFLVEGFDGKPVYTEYNMNMYRQWFEREAKINTDIRHINATQGGVFIQGMEHMRFDEALSQCCPMDRTYDFKAIIDHVPPFFDREQRKEILSDLATLEERLKDIRHSIREGLSLYDRFDQFVQRQNFGEAFRTTYERITELNNWITYDEDVNFLNYYSRDEEYEVKEIVYESQGSDMDDLKHTIAAGRKLFCAKLDATDRFWKDYEPICEEAKCKLKEYEG